MIYAWIEGGRHRQEETNLAPAAGWWIRFDDRDHTYTTCEGIQYQSCTQFIASTDKPFARERISLDCAAQREGRYKGMSPAEIQAQWEDTAVVGSELHAAIEAHLNGLFRRSRKEHRPFVPQVDQFAAWQAENLPETVRAERIFWSRKHHLAGMFDVVSFDPSKGATIDDIKSYNSMTKDRKKKASLQLTLGCMMLEETLGCQANVGGIILWEGYYRLRKKSTLSYVPCKRKDADLVPALYARRYHAIQKEEDMGLSFGGGRGSRPKRICLHGTEGIGKSTFGASFENFAVLDLEGSTAAMDLPPESRIMDDKTGAPPTKWSGLKMLVQELVDAPKLPCKVLVVDTIDWAELLAKTEIARGKNKTHFADIAYGAGDKALADTFKELLDQFEEIQAKHDVTVVLLAHTAVKRFDPPDLPEGYERYELALTKHVSAMVKQWCDMVLFANDVAKVKKDEKDTFKKAKGVGDGSDRIVHTTKHDAYDAKNRYQMPDALPFTLEKMSDFCAYLLKL